MCGGNHGNEDCKYKPNQLKEQGYEAKALFNIDPSKLLRAFGYMPNPEAYLKAEELSGRFTGYKPQRVLEEE